MKCLYSLIVLIAILTIVIALPAAGDSSQLLTGWIESVDKRPIAGVQVSIAGVSTTTNSKGFFQLVVAKARHYSIDLTGSGFYNSYHTFAHFDLGSSDSNENLKIPKIVMVRRKRDRVMFAFAGDTMLARRYLDPLSGEPALIRRFNQKSDMRKIVRLAKPYLELADFTSVNLETQLIDKPGLIPIPKSVTFFTHPDIVPVLQEAGVDYVALGNNHTFDYGDIGLRSTLSALENFEMPSSGAGMNESEARRPLSVVIGERKFALFSFVGWSGGFMPNQVAGISKGGAALGLYKNLIQAVSAADKSATTILQVHSGIEYQSKPSLNEITRYRGAIDAGADLVLGHHPHVLQGFDLYNNRLIAYSLGNFLFDQYIYATQAGMILYVWMDGDMFFRAEIVPMFLNGYIPTPASGDIHFDVLQRLTHLSNQSKLKFSLSGAHGTMVPRQTAVAFASLDASNLEPGVVTHLRNLGLGATDNIAGVKNGNGAFRLGLDLLKRGTFETSGEFNTFDRSWITTNNVTIVNKTNQELRITGSARTGMKTFDRVFSISNPATVSATIRSSGDASVVFYLQRRKQGESLQVALKTGSLQEIGRVSLEPGQANTLNLNFNMPRASSKGVRLLIDVLQSDDGVLDIDDLTWVEWNTPWINSGGGEFSVTLQATHIQMQVEPTL